MPKLTYKDVDVIIDTINTGDDFKDEHYDILYTHFVDSGEMPYGVAKARTGDPYAWIADELDKIPDLRDFLLRV